MLDLYNRFLLLLDDKVLSYCSWSFIHFLPVDLSVFTLYAVLVVVLLALLYIAGSTVIGVLVRQPRWSGLRWLLKVEWWSTSCILLVLVVAVYFVAAVDFCYLSLWFTQAV